MYTVPLYQIVDYVDYTIVDAIHPANMRFMWLYQSFYERMRRAGGYNIRVEA